MPLKHGIRARGWPSASAGLAAHPPTVGLSNSTHGAYTERKSTIRSQFMDQPTLAALLDRIQRDDESALVALYDHFAAAVFSVALQVLQSQQDAEEVTQDVFLRIWHKSALYDPDKGQFLTWLLTMTRRLAIDHLRRRQRAAPPPTAASLDEHEYLWEQALVYDDLSDLQRTLLSALRELPLEYQQAIALAYFRGLTHAEIAQQLGRPLGTVKSHIRQGMEQLRSIWISAGK